MSNIYILEPPTSAKVIIKTTVGEIDVELWAKETPKTCRNFIQLCLEGYYNGTIFHRVVKGFIAQGGDPLGDGTGGESVYGETFKDEFHQRLRFTRRGLLAMANAGKDDNASQFFFTLGATPELQNKHTLFGKVTGETIFNMLKLEEGLIDDERPAYPHKIIKTEVLNNPFPDIVPRVLEKTKKEGKKKKKDRTPGVKNFKLLSFGTEAEEDEEETVRQNEKFSGKSKSTHDVLDDPKLSSEPFDHPGIKSNKNSRLNEDSSDTSDSDRVEVLENIRKKIKMELVETASNMESDSGDSSESDKDEIRKSLEYIRKQRKPMENTSFKKIEFKNEVEDVDETEEGLGTKDNNQKDEVDDDDSSDTNRKERLENIKKKLKIKKKIEKPNLEEYQDELMLKVKKLVDVKKEIESVKREYHKNKLKKEEEKVEAIKKEDKTEIFRNYNEECRQYKAKLMTVPLKGSVREDFTLSMLAKFRNKLNTAKELKSEESEKEQSSVNVEKKEINDADLDDEKNWLTHELHFEDPNPVLAKDANTKDDDWFEIYDPRNPLNKRRRGETSKSKK